MEEKAGSGAGRNAGYGELLIDSVLAQYKIKKKKKNYMIGLIVLISIIIFLSYLSYILSYDVELLMMPFIWVIVLLIILRIVIAESRTVFRLRSPKMYSEGILDYDIENKTVVERFIRYDEIRTIIAKQNKDREKMLGKLLAQQKRRKAKKEWTEDKFRLAVQQQTMMVNENSLYIVTKDETVIEWNKSWIDNPRTFTKILEEKNVTFITK